MDLPARRPISRIHPSAYLLAAQLLLLILYSVFDESQSQLAWISAFGVVVLILCVWVINRSPGFDWVAWALAVPALVLTILSAFTTNPPLLVLESLLYAALYFYAAASLIAYMMKDYRVTTDELFAAGATFTLFAWGFAYLFLICQTLIPGSYTGGVGPKDTFTFFELLFLSFTNLSSAGLSDILPVSTTARALLMLEQFVGIGYVAVVISRLVGLTIQKQSEKP
jgi:hypothetical protein